MSTSKINEQGRVVIVKEIGGGEGYTLYVSKDGNTYYSLDDGSDQIYEGSEDDAISEVCEYVDYGEKDESYENQ